MKCLLCDINPAMREAWEKELERRPRLAALCSVVAGGITDLRRLYPRFRGRRGKPVAGNHPYASRGGTAGRGSSHRAYRTFGHPVADLRADHAQAFRAS